MRAAPLSLMLATEPNARRLNAAIVGSVQASQLFSKVATAACDQREVLRSIRARALLELCESPDRDDELTGSPALKQRVWRKAHDKRVGAVPQTRKTQGRPDAVSDAVKEPRRV